MNLNTVLLAVIAVAVVAVAGVYLNDHFNPTTPGERLLQQSRQHQAECEKVTGFSERIAKRCD